MLLHHFLATFLLLSSYSHCLSSSSCSCPSHIHLMPYHTACQQCSYLTHIPPSFSIIRIRSRTLRCRNSFLLAFLLLSGIIESNPGPTNFTLCTLNSRSILNPLHSAALSDLIDSHQPDLFCLTEPWIKPTSTTTELMHCTPPNYSLLSFPRTSSNNTHSSANGRSTGFLIREPCTQLSTAHSSFTSIESSSVTLKLHHSQLSVFNIYRPSASSNFC